MKKVLVAIDIARHGGNDGCLKTAQDIAKTMDATLILLHVIESIPRYYIPSMPPGAISKWKLEAEEEARKLAEKYGCSDVVVREGVPATKILEYASEINADLIVLNSHDPELFDYLFGSVANRVVQHAHCSVHVARQHDAAPDVPPDVANEGT
ncbi:MAG: universal stress protein [Rhodospirillales bacterium]|nr:universal stress protein [Alphaproteobacteria bacterium]MBL6947043.1 universal stress protein [Rhodospirillales bacterium]